MTTAAKRRILLGLDDDAVWAAQCVVPALDPRDTFYALRKGKSLNEAKVLYENLKTYFDLMSYDLDRYKFGPNFDHIIVPPKNRYIDSIRKHSTENRYCIYFTDASCMVILYQSIEIYGPTIDCLKRMYENTSYTNVIWSATHGPLEDYICFNCQWIGPRFEPCEEHI